MPDPVSCADEPGCEETPPVLFLLELGGADGCPAVTQECPTRNECRKGGQGPSLGDLKDLLADIQPGILEMQWELAEPGFAKIQSPRVDGQVLLVAHVEGNPLRGFHFWHLMMHMGSSG